MTSTQPQLAAVSKQSGSARSFDWLLRSGLLVAVVILFIALSLIAPAFLSERNLINVLRAVAFNGIIACAMTFVIISGDIDVSVGSAIAWSSSLLGVLSIQQGWNLELTILVVLVQGAIIHMIAGYIRCRWSVPAFVVTLTLFISLRGAARLITNAYPITPFPDYFSFIGGGFVLEGLPFQRGIPIPVIIMLLTFVAFYYISRYTVFGRSVYSVGGNEEAARLSGIPIWRTRITIFGLTGFLAAFCGVLISSRIMSGASNIADGLEFEVIAAVIIGGTSLSGGAGSIAGTFLGVLFIGLLSNGMTLMGIPQFVQEIVRGLIILFAVLISIWQNSLQNRTRKPVGG